MKFHLGATVNDYEENEGNINSKTCSEEGMSYIMADSGRYIISYDV